MNRRFPTLLCIVMTVAAAVASPAAEPRTPEPVAEALRRLLVEEPRLVLDVLRRHPEEVFDIVREGVAAKQARAEAERIDEQVETPLEPVVEADRPILGPSDAPATVVVYSDFLCHFCDEAAFTLGELMSRHEGVIRLVAKHHPLSPLSRRAALYFEALARQAPRRAWQFHDEVFMRQDEIQEKGEAVLDEIARAAGGDMERLAADVERPELAARIAADTEEAEAFGFDGTPAVILNGVALPGARPLEVYERVLARTLDRRRPETAPDAVP